MYESLHIKVQVIKTSKMETIEKRLAAFRETTQLTKKAFAESISMDSGLYGRYEAGANKPSFETLEKIVTRYPKLSLSWLVGGVGQMFSTQSQAGTNGNEVERIRQLERELAREKAWTEKLWEENQSFRELGKKLASPEAADAHLAPMWVAA
jgi:transcriptional regulator with XRE-family HTH domain